MDAIKAMKGQNKAIFRDDIMDNIQGHIEYTAFGEVITSLLTKQVLRTTTDSEHFDLI